MDDQIPESINSEPRDSGTGNQQLVGRSKTQEHHSGGVSTDTQGPHAGEMSPRARDAASHHTAPTGKNQCVRACVRAYVRACVLVRGGARVQESSAGGLVGSAVGIRTHLLLMDYPNKHTLSDTATTAPGWGGGGVVVDSFRKYRRCKFKGAFLPLAEGWRDE